MKKETNVYEFNAENIAPTPSILKLRTPGQSPRNSRKNLAPTFGATLSVKRYASTSDVK